MSDDSQINDGEITDHEITDHEITDLLHRRAGRGDERGPDAVWRAADASGSSTTTHGLSGTSRLAVAAVLLVLAAVGVGLFSSLTNNDSGLVITQTPGDSSSPSTPDGSTPRPAEQITPSTGQPDPPGGGASGDPSNIEGEALGEDQAPPFEASPDQAPPSEASPDRAPSADVSEPDADGDPNSRDSAPNDGAGEEPPAEPAPGAGTDRQAITDWVTYKTLGSIESARSEPNGAGWVDFLTPGPEAGANGGTIRRTGTSQRFIEGRLVIEVDYAATVEGRGDSAWGEIVVSQSDGPSADVGGSYYATQRFRGDAALGCRLQSDRHVFCQLFAPDGERIWQMSWFAPVGDQQVVNADPKSWRVCDSGAAAPDCLNRFRIELTADSVLVAVNGEIVLHETNVAGIPAALIDNEVYVYASSLLSRHPEPLARFDWGPLWVNPGT